MTNPTSNYGFVLPTSTDLVTDLPADFEVALQGVDTRLKALQPGTTLGDIAYSSATANTNTRLGIGTSGQVLAVSGGGVPAWTTTADVTPLTTKGDLFTFDTADARLGVGTNGQTLVADSSTSTGLKWATPATAGSGMTFISRTSFSNVASQAIDSVFSSSYFSYVAIIENIYAATDTDNLMMQLRVGATTITASAYYGSTLTTTRSNTTTTNTPSNGANEMTIALESGTSTNPSGAIQITFNQVGNSSQNGNFAGYGNIGGSGFGLASFACKVVDANTFTGFILKSGSSNITGAVSVYGLAKA